MATQVERVSSDALAVRRRANLPAAALALAAAAAWAALLLWRGPSSRDGLALWAAGALLVPWLGLRLARALERPRRVLVRGGGRLVLDGQPLDVARIETRLVRHPLLRLPSGFAVSLWGMEVDGRPVELDLGRYRTLMEASAAAGELEEFLEVAKTERAQRAR